MNSLEPKCGANTVPLYCDSYKPLTQHNTAMYEGNNKRRQVLRIYSSLPKTKPVRLWRDTQYLTVRTKSDHVDV